jgi:type I restriction enzyme, S subunit
MLADRQRFGVNELIERGKLFVGDGYRAKNEELTNSGLPFARASNINNGFRFIGADRFPEENLGRVGNKVSQPGDVVFTSKGTVGRFGFVRPETPRFVYSPQLCFWRSLDTEVIDPRFLYYWMSGREFYLQFTGVAGQTDMADYVSLTDQRGMHITLPSIGEQRGIAKSLGSLDDKIEINRRMNETLEGIARAIFKSWFVDLDPVHVNVQGGDPRLPADIANLFPDRLVQSELGEIPEGWRTAKLPDIVDIAGGGTPKTSVAEFWNGEIPWFSVADSPTDSDIWVLATERSITSEGLDNCAARLLLPGATIITARGTVGQLALVGIPMAINQSCYGLIPRLGVRGFFCYFLARTLIAELKQRSHGSVFETITRATLDAIEIVRPPAAIVDCFEALVGPILDRMRASLLEAVTLRRLRDVLLPKLLSGDMRANAAREAAGAA